MMKVIKRIDPMSAAKVMAGLGAITGLIAGILIAILGSSSPMSYMMGTYSAMQPSLGKLSVLAIIIMPIVYAIAGFISGLVWSVFYNFVAGKIGGIKIELK